MSEFPKSMFTRCPIYQKADVVVIHASMYDTFLEVASELLKAYFHNMAGL